MDADGTLRFFPLTQGFELTAHEVDLGMEIEQVKHLVPLSSYYAALSPEGDLLIFTIDYSISFDGNLRKVQPVIIYPFEEDPITLGNINDFEVWFEDSEVRIAALGADLVTIHSFEDAEEGLPLEAAKRGRIRLEENFDRLFFGPDGRWLYLIASDGRLDLYDIRNTRRAKHQHSQRITEGEVVTAAIAPLLGRYSLLVASGETVVQWVFGRDESGYLLQPIRDFEFPKPVTQLVPEHRRKGFVAIDESGQAHFAFTTSGKIVASAAPTVEQSGAAISPRADLWLAASVEGEVETFVIHNEHPDVSMRTLAGKVWYEGYPGPIYSWQSSSAGNDFEAKFSLMPLLYGTLKAATYAMIVAVPLAILGAMYTAFFMAPQMRRVVKPGIEIMAALPTVVLGFLAGLWLAPFIEAHLAGVFTTVLVLPAGLLLLAWIFGHMPDRIQRACNGWYGLIAMAPIVLIVWGSLELAPVLETRFWGGSLRAWLLAEFGITYDQRNALVVGLAMGMAVVPTIFSIAEDAIFGVPRHLINGSLALGATPWQTLTRVVLLTASPGLFSAVMIGFGRAVGETMIVLMATGNTPVMDFSAFEGMRTFAANIAVEMPEAEVDSSHFRILFLTALVLFLLTFAVNSIAEIVRQRLRARYGSL
jgi:phosphate transport system permease protein